MNMANPMSETDKDVLAGELAFGVLEGEERAAALRLMLSDRDFAVRVDRWREQSAGLFDAIADVDPPAGAWDGIARRIAPPAASASAQAVRWWRAGAIGAGAMAAGLAALLLLQQPAAPALAPSGQFAVAQLSGPIAGLRIATRYDPATATLRVRATGMPDTPTQPELWVVPADGVPRSLGQIGRDGETVIVVAEGRRRMINPSARLQLSMEPPSPTPSSEPTSDMVATGAIDLI